MSTPYSPDELNGYLFNTGHIKATCNTQRLIVPMLRRGNSAQNALAFRDAGALQTEFPRQSVRNDKKR